MASDGGREPDDVLYQDARWMRMARVQYGMVAYPLWILGLAASSQFMRRCARQSRELSLTKTKLYDHVDRTCEQPVLSSTPA
jgi:hypothetical protein